MHAYMCVHVCTLCNVQCTYMDTNVRIHVHVEFAKLMMKAPSENFSLVGDLVLGGGR